MNFSKDISFFNLNTHYADLYFDGTGEINFTHATTSGFALTTTNATSKKAKVVFDTGIKFNNASVFYGNGKGSENSQLLFKGETNFNSYMQLSNIKFSLNGSTKKFVRGDIAAMGDSIVEFTNGANVQSYGGYKGRGASVINIDSASSYTLNNTNYFYVGTANEHSATANIWGTVNAATSTLQGTGAATFNLKEGGKATFKTVKFTDNASNMKMNIDGAMNVSGQFSTDSNNDMVVGKTGTLAVDGLFLITGNLTTAAGRISTTFNSTGNELNGNIKMNEFGGFRVNADNKWNSSVLFRGGRTQFAVGKDATFEINSLLSISSISGKSSTITLGDSGQRSLRGFRRTRRRHKQFARHCRLRRKERSLPCNRHGRRKRKVPLEGSHRRCKERRPALRRARLGGGRLLAYDRSRTRGMGCNLRGYRTRLGSLPQTQVGL